MNIVNHFKVLQKFMSTKIFNNVTINELHMDTYNDVALLEDKKKKRKQKKIRRIVTKNQFRELVKDKRIDLNPENDSDRGVFVLYMNTSSKNALEIIKKEDIYGVGVDKLIIEENGVEVLRFKLSTLLSKLKGETPFIIKGNEITIKFDNIFIYDYSCNIACIVNQIEDQICKPELMKGDVQNKHTIFDFMKRLLDNNIDDMDPQSLSSEQNTAINKNTEVNIPSKTNSISSTQKMKVNTDSAPSKTNSVSSTQKMKVNADSAPSKTNSVSSTQKMKVSAPSKTNSVSSTQKMKVNADSAPSKTNSVSSTQKMKVNADSDPSKTNSVSSIQKMKVNADSNPSKTRSDSSKKNSVVSKRNFFNFFRKKQI
jgi:hypothetical protein